MGNWLAIALVVSCLVVMGSLALRADASERFSMLWQISNQKGCLVLYTVETRERWLRGWVIGLLLLVVLLATGATAATLGFLAESAKDYWSASENALRFYWFGMCLFPAAAIIAFYHLVGMIVRLRAWRQVLIDMVEQPGSK